jgi:hypothetical protein
LLGDDLYANHNTCKAVVEWGLSFLFTCKDESHPWIAEQVRWGEAETLVITEWNGRNHLEYRYRWINGIENRAEGGKLRAIIPSCKPIGERSKSERPTTRRG